MIWQILVILTEYDKIEIRKSSYDVATVMSSQLHHRKSHQNNVTKFFHQLKHSDISFSILELF